MSEVKLNLVDNQQVLHGTIHGSVADRCVAALSAEPETIAELSAALARYIKPLDDQSPFAWFHSSPHLSIHTALSSFPESLPLDSEPWDAGIVVIDLAARIVACESTYSAPESSGEVHYHDGTKSTDVPIRYRLPDDWLFVNSVDSYQWSRERRVRQRLAETPLDARSVLYGLPLLEFIADACETLDIPEISSGDNGSYENQEDHEADEALAARISDIHERWLMTPREDLRGQSPRDLLFEKRDFVDYDLESRSLQWSLLDEGPPCLSVDSFAYRFAGFGTHEWVVYYDLIRHLIWSAPSCWKPGNGNGPQASAQVFAPPDRNSVITRLEQLKSTWLEEPQPDYDGRTPAIIIDNERKRLPIAIHPRDMVIDDDCPMCQMLGDETSPLGMGVGFWHLDGCNMDDRFAFSWCRTRQEWEAENQRREEFNREFERKMKEREERIARGEAVEPYPFLDPDPLPDWDFDPSRSISGTSTEQDDEISQ